MTRNPLVIVPTHCSSEEQMSLTERCLRTLADTAMWHLRGWEVLVVDDGSPVPYAEQVNNWAQHLGFGVHMKDRNTGFSATVNHGLTRARDEGRDAVLLNADVELRDPAWLGNFYRPEVPEGASVQGAVLYFPTQPPFVQHAGVYFSVMRRQFDHVHRYAPPDIGDLSEWRRCPVTGALMWIGAEVLREVGLFDDGFKLGWEDVDYCLRTFDSGRECWVNPYVWAVHHESVFRRTSDSPQGAREARHHRWKELSHERLWEKHAGLDFSGYVPTMLGV